jgi:hypothetical protein
LEDIYPSLRWNSDWQDTQEDFYDNLEAVIDDENNKEWEEYQDFYDALYGFVDYTIDEID